MIRFFLNASRSFRKNEDGTASIEFVIFLPIFFAIFLACFELSYTMLRQSWLERAVDLTVRDIRLGAPVGGLEGVSQAVCDNMGTFLSKDCEANIRIKMNPIDRTTWALPDLNVDCLVEEDFNPGDSDEDRGFIAGTENQMVLLRACVLIDPFFSAGALSRLVENFEQLDSDGIALVATSGFVIEPGFEVEG